MDLSHMTCNGLGEPRPWAHSVGLNLPFSVCKKADGLSEGEGLRAVEQTMFTQGTVSLAHVTVICLIT